MADRATTIEYLAHAYHIRNAFERAMQAEHPAPADCIIAIRQGMPGIQDSYLLTEAFEATLEKELAGLKRN